MSEMYKTIFGTMFLMASLMFLFQNCSPMNVGADNSSSNQNSNHKYTINQTMGMAGDQLNVFHDGDFTSIAADWYVDGVFYQTQHEWRTFGAAYPAPFDRRFHLLLNVAVGGNWPGSPDASTVFPQQMYVDYVRVYQ